MSGAQGGCGGTGACQCASRASARVATVNGIALHAAGEAVTAEDLRERAWAELLRQEAVRQGLLPRHGGLEMPLLDAAGRAAIEGMLDAVVPTPAPGAGEARRHYDANLTRFTTGARARVRHILFAVTGGVDVEALAARAEQALHELKQPGTPATRFAALARELSNCPSGADGGELGWLAPQEIAPELARELFHGPGPQPTGLRPRLVHSRYGLHVMEVLDRHPGQVPAFEQVQPAIVSLLAQQARGRALHQYIRLLAGRALVEGVDLEAAPTPLVQ